MRYSPDEIVQMSEFDILHTMDELDAELEDFGYVDSSNRMTYDALVAELDDRDAARVSA